MSGPVVLYGAADMARALGTTPQALSNRRARGSPRVDVPCPVPRYVTRSGRPLWTREQVEAVLAERAAAARRALELDTRGESV